MLETKKIIFNIDEFNHFVCVIMSVCVCWEASQEVMEGVLTQCMIEIVLNEAKRFNR